MEIHRNNLLVLFIFLSLKKRRFELFYHDQLVYELSKKTSKSYNLKVLQYCDSVHSEKYFKVAMCT